MYTGALCQSFSPHTGEICPGDHVTFTCVLDAFSTLWIVTLQGDGTVCVYRRDDPDPQSCGPDGRFMSAATDVNGDINNSSLSVDSITIDLNETQVNCTNGVGVTVGSDSVCIVGKNIIL